MALETIVQIQKEPVVFYSESIEINAPVENVWKLMTDIENWSAWNDNIKWAKLNGSLKAGTSFIWKSGPGKIKSKLTKVEKNESIVWSGKTMGIYAEHSWKIENKGNATIVTTAESWNGLIPKLLPKQSKKILQKAIGDGLNKLKQAAEHEEVSTTR